MNKLFLVFVCLAVILFNYTISQAQTSDWVRVSSDDGEFSIEVPAKYSFFYDKVGVFTSKDRNNYQLQNMYLLNAFADGALLSFERYQSRKGGLDALYQEEEWRAKYENIIFSEIKSNGTNIRQTTTKTDKFYCVKQYFNSKSHIYVLTAASRDSANQTIKRFLDSLVFKPDTKEKPDTNSISFSSLKAAPVLVKQADSDKKVAKDSSPKLPVPQGLEPLVVVKKPQAGYTDSARMKNIQGAVNVRVTFNENGFVPQMEVIKSLPEGLLRQALFSILRIKFLPQIKDGKPESVTKVVEHRFSIY